MRISIDMRFVAVEKSHNPEVHRPASDTLTRGAFSFQQR